MQSVHAKQPVTTAKPHFLSCRTQWLYLCPVRSCLQHKACDIAQPALVLHAQASQPHLPLPVTNLTKARFCWGSHDASTCHRHCSTSCSLVNSLTAPTPTPPPPAAAAAAAVAWPMPASLVPGLLLLSASSSSSTTLNTLRTSKSAESSAAGPHKALAKLAPLKQQSNKICGVQQRTPQTRVSTRSSAHSATLHEAPCSS
jgi:hypothetical protein